MTRLAEKDEQGFNTMLDLSLQVTSIQFIKINCIHKWQFKRF